MEGNTMIVHLVLQANMTSSVRTRLGLFFLKIGCSILRAKYQEDNNDG